MYRLGLEEKGTSLKGQKVCHVRVYDLGRVWWIKILLFRKRAW